MVQRLHYVIAALILSTSVVMTTAFTVSITKKSSSTQRFANHHKSTQGRSTPRGGKERSKRQERVGHLVRTELSTIIHRGLIKGDPEYLDDELRRRISIINADVSPDLRQARIVVSIRKGGENEAREGTNAAVDRRRAYSWLVANTKYIRHTLAQKLSHMKTVPNLSFVQADVSAAVDVMYLIDKVAAGYKRESIGAFGGDNDAMPQGVVAGIDFDDMDEADWDDDFFLDDDDNEDEGDGTEEYEDYEDDEDYNDDDDDDPMTIDDL
jgi:ribosome-binding factor A